MLRQGGELLWAKGENFLVVANRTKARDYYPHFFADMTCSVCSLRQLRSTRFYLDSGWPRDNYEVTRAMHNALTEKGYAEGQDLLYFAFPQAAHNEKSWAMRIHLPFQFFFRPAAW